MDDTYDVVVCGTGFKECMLSGLLSLNQKKVLHLDRNSYYGGESASLNLTNLFAKFEPGVTPPESWGANRNWNIDLIPKFIMSGGELVKILVKSQVKDYLEFKVVEGSYVYQHQKGGWFTAEKFIHKVPSSDTEALTSSLIPYTEKLAGKKFFVFAMNWDRDDPKTWGKFNPASTPMQEVYKSFNLQANTIDFIGHALALYSTDDYLTKPMGETMDRFRLYLNSLVRYGSSPFIYPMHGLGVIPEGFSRLSAVNGGTYMLQKPIKEFKYDAEGKVCGVEAEDGEIAKCSMVICDPSYVQNTPKIKKTGRVIRVTNILNAPIPNTGDRRSCQIILPQKQLGRKHDIYIAMVSSTHGVAAEGKYVALVSTVIETEDPMLEIAPAVKLLGPVEKQFINISDIWEATDDGTKDNVHVTHSYDASSHFESATEDVLRVWRDITGSDLDLNVKPRTEEGPSPTD